MFFRTFGQHFALVAILCVLSIFLFPASAGPYSVVHGPLTALQAIRLAVRVRWAMMLAGLAFAQLLGLSVAECKAVAETLLPSGLMCTGSSVLRC
jgi:hypothetical protein